MWSILTSLIPFALLIFNLVVLDLLIFLNYTLLQRNFKMGADDKIANPDCTPMAYNETGYSSFNQFYPFYLGEHHNQTNRRMHIIGTTNALSITTVAVVSGCYPLMLLAVGQAYGMAWIGHFFIEKNRPATFKHPFYSVS